MRPITLLINALAFVGSACSSSTAPTTPHGDVSIVVNAEFAGAAAFTPNPFTAAYATQQRVVWVNGDVKGGSYGGSGGVTHHLVSDTPGLFDSGNFLPGTTFAFTFAAAGTYPYHCTIHPTMVGSITFTP